MKQEFLLPDLGEGLTEAEIVQWLVAEGDAMINRVYHLDRGFEALEAKLGRCGARIERISG